jgi:hypothetical protein
VHGKVPGRSGVVVHPHSGIGPISTTGSTRRAENDTQGLIP